MRLALLWVLYFVQGLPFGFQSKCLPLLLRERGFTLSQIGYAHLLSAPWTLKFLVSPFIDRWGRGAPMGHRKSWILPTQLCLIGACVIASRVVVSGWVRVEMRPGNIWNRRGIAVSSARLGQHSIRLHPRP
jgi:PAT family beta-lactamase induction signal transducer AmpG|eukprot:COSAG01_NODE_22113_length_871_cov_0.980570_1_plen_131_part_00